VAQRAFDAPGGALGIPIRIFEGRLDGVLGKRAELGVGRADD
jgi:hypothetical protein